MNHYYPFYSCFHAVKTIDKFVGHWKVMINKDFQFFVEIKRISDNELQGKVCNRELILEYDHAITIRLSIDRKFVQLFGDVSSGSSTINWSKRNEIWVKENGKLKAFR